MPSMIGAGLTFNTQTGMSSQFGFKQSGSSIADYSDNALPSRSQPFQGFRGGPFSAQNHLVHPSAPGQGGTQSGLTFRSRDIRGAPVPVFLPQAREVRVNGSFLNSSRGFQQQPAPRFASVNNPFRSSSSKRPAISEFPPHEGQPSRFDFSRVDSEEGDRYELQPVTPHDLPQEDCKDDILRADRLSSQFDLAAQPDSRISQGSQYRLFPQEYISSPTGPFPEAHVGARQRGITRESEDSGDSSLHGSPFFDLVPLNVAQRRAAERRASGRDDPSHVLRAHGSALRRATRNISFNASFATNVSNAGSPLTAPSEVETPPSRRVSRFVPRVLGQSAMHGRSHMMSPLATLGDDGDVKNNGKAPSILPIYEILQVFSSHPANCSARKGHLLSQGDSRPTISTITASDMTTHTITQADGSQAFIFDPPPRLHPSGWHLRRHAAPQSTDPSLAQIHLGERADSANHAVISHRHHQYHGHSISDLGQQRRRVFFMIIAMISVLPFISPIALCGGFNTALQWHTRGEVDRFSPRQTRFLFIEMIASVIVFTAVVVFVVLKFAAHH